MRKNLLVLAFTGILLLSGGAPSYAQTALDSDVAVLKKMVAGLDYQVRELQTQMSQANARLAASEQTVTTTRSELQAARASIDQINAKLAAAEQTDLATRSDLQAAKASIVQINAKLAAAENTDMATRSELQAAKASIVLLTADSALAKANDNDMYVMLLQWEGALCAWKGSHFIWRPFFIGGRFEHH